MLFMVIERFKDRDAVPVYRRVCDEGKIVEVDETYFGPTAEDRVSPQRKGRPYNPRGSRE